MTGRTRACDRCAALKTVCDRKVPCARCVRLKLGCTIDRPVLVRGRPKKVTREQNRSSTDVHSPKTKAQANVLDAQMSLSTEVSDAEVLDGTISDSDEDSFSKLGQWSASTASTNLVTKLLDLPIPHGLAAHVLDRLLSSVDNIGILGALRKNHHLIAQDSNGPSNHDSPTTSLLQSPFLLYTLITIGFELCCPSELADRKLILVDSLRVYALNHVPDLTKRGQQNRIEDGYSLALLSSLGCLSLISVEIAERWAVLACVIERQYLIGRNGEDREWREFHRRSSCAIILNDRVLALLHHRPPFTFSTSAAHNILSDPSRGDAVPESYWHSGWKLDNSIPLTAKPGDESFLDLMLPLIKPLDTALMKQHLSMEQWRLAISDLEDYYFNFPPVLLNFATVSHLFQLECMIWFHGIYILLYGKWDLLDMLEDKEWIKSASFLYTLEHSLLIGEVLNASMRFHKSFRQLCAGTIFFILSSAIVHAVALSVVASDEGGNHDAFDKLRASAVSHLQAVTITREQSEAYRLPLLGAVEDILKTMIEVRSNGCIIELIDLEGLRPYRWKGKGLGVVKCQLSDADMWEDKRTNGSANISHLQQEGISGGDIIHNIMSMCDDNLRLCELGYFDLSIRL